MRPLDVSSSADPAPPATSSDPDRRPDATSVNAVDSPGDAAIELHFRRVLVAIDGSSASRLALAAAVAVARRDGAILTVMTVVRDVAADAARWSGALMVPADSQDAADADAERLLRAAVNSLPKDISVRTVLRRGKAGPRIVEEADHGTYDAVFLGARGLGRIAAVVGSVSQFVVHHATTAVFIAHPARDDA